MKSILCEALVCYLLTSLALGADEQITVTLPKDGKPIGLIPELVPERLITTTPEEFKVSTKLIKAILRAKTIGLELYSPLALPEIKADETKESVLTKLQNAGFKVLEKDGVFNIVDAKERPTGETPYPFAQRVKISAGMHGFHDLLIDIKKQTGFEMHCFLYMFSFRPKWDIALNFPHEDEMVSVREILNRAASQADGMWVVERLSFELLSRVDGKDVRTERPKIREHDAGELYLPEAK